MASKKKPEGQQWEMLVESWYANTHEGKLCLAQTYGVTFDTLKHWISESGATRKRVASFNDPDLSRAIREVLAIPTKTKLDFVSFDIETSELKADFSALLSASIKPYGKEGIVFRADNYQNWKEGRRADDLEICRDITNELAQHAVVITHYGTGFDLRYIRAKMMHHGLPALPPMFAVDTYYLAKANMMVSRRRLDAICKYLALGLKSVVEGAVWVEAALNGSQEALDEIVAHNVQDCILLEKVAMVMFPYLRSLKRL